MLRSVRINTADSLLFPVVSSIVQGEGTFLVPKVPSFDQRQQTHWATMSVKEEVGKFFLAVLESLVSAGLVKAIKFTWRRMRLRRKNRKQTLSEMMTSSLAIQRMCLDLLREMKAMTSTLLEKQEYCQREIEALKAVTLSLTDPSGLSGEGQSGTSNDNSSPSHARGTQSAPTPNGLGPEPLGDARKPAKKK